jgi:hypothetical protein
MRAKFYDASGQELHFSEFEADGGISFMQSGNVLVMFETVITSRPSLSGSSIEGDNKSGYRIVKGGDKTTTKHTARVATTN